MCEHQEDELSDFVANCSAMLIINAIVSCFFGMIVKSIALVFLEDAASVDAVYAYSVAVASIFVPFALCTKKNVGNSVLVSLMSFVFSAHILRSMEVLPL